MTMAQNADAIEASVAPRPWPLRWWREVLYVFAAYGAYSLVRNTFASGTESTARRHAVQIMRWQTQLGINNEANIQDWFIHHFLIGPSAFLRIWNIYYGTFHFIVPIVALVVLYRRHSNKYALWRNVIFTTTALGLIGFALYPLMPPRMFPELGFVDSIDTYGSIWTFEDGPVQKLSNQFAAMPSLHCAWALWCALVFASISTKWWTKALAFVYPVATVFAIVITANHYWLDAVGGFVTLGAGLALGTYLTRWWHTHFIHGRATPKEKSPSLLT